MFRAFSVGLPRSLCSLAMTNFASSFGGSVGNADDRGLYVILSVSEISHDQSGRCMPLALAMTENSIVLRFFSF